MKKESSAAAYGEFDCEFDCDAHEWSCSCKIVQSYTTYSFKSAVRAAKSSVSSSVMKLPFKDLCMSTDRG